MGASDKVHPGITVFLETEHRRWRGKRLGLFTNQTGVTEDLEPNVSALLSCSGLRLVALYGGEHGVRGDQQAGIAVTSYTDPETGLPVYSLYAGSKGFPPGNLEILDAIIIDIQDGGVRFYTYISAMWYILMAAGKSHTPVIVLDRPNPVNGIMIEGNVARPEFQSYVAIHPIALRHGMTIGELALLFNEESKFGTDISVVKMRNWTRTMWYDETGLDWVLPSPNLPAVESMVVYPGMCLFEGTNVSEGRGTTRPFEIFGAPWLNAGELRRRLAKEDLPGVGFSEIHFVPTFSKYAGEVCNGLQIHVRDRSRFIPTLTFLRIIETVKRLHPAELNWRIRNDGSNAMDRLMGTDEFRLAIDGGKSIDEIVWSWESEALRFKQAREKFLLYD